MTWSTLTTLIRCRLDDVGGRRVVRVAGELDLASVEPLSRLLAGELSRSEWLTVDLSQLTFIDASGIGLLVRMHHRAETAGGRFTLRRPHRRVRHVLSVLGLLRVLDVERIVGPSPSLDMIGVLDEALDGAMRIADAQFADAQLADPAGVLQLVAHRGFDRAFLDYFHVVDGDTTACAMAMATHRPVWVRDVETSRIFAGTAAGTAMLDAGCNAVASLPLALPGGVAGIISVHREAPTDWSSASKHRLAEHSRFAASVLSTLPVPACA